MNNPIPSIEVHPVQTRQSQHGKAACPKVVTMAAYEVYCHLYGLNEALITGGCRGGFSSGELIAFLYAKSYPRGQWAERVKEAFEGMEHL